MTALGSMSEAAVTSPEDLDAWRSRGPRPSALVELHRHSLLNVLVLGGTSVGRSRVARAFHERSPLRAAPFVAVDASRDEPRVREALIEWLRFGGRGGMNHLRACERGTLFLDRVEALTDGTQRLLLALGLASTHGSAGDWRGRLIAGSDVDLTRESRAGRFQPALFDVLDKVRVELSPELGVACA